MKLAIFSFCFLFFTTVQSQEPINRFDENGKRHGKWSKTFEDSHQIRYEGNFSHGQEVGLFKFYKLGIEHPAATKLFVPGSELVEVTYFSKKGAVISEGKMKHKERIGTWKYYHLGSDQLMMTETYKNGRLNGEKITYFENGKPAEKSFYKDGELDGEQFIYAKTGVLLKHLHYQNEELHGPAKFYDAKGTLIIEGNYKNNRHSGIWKYYEHGDLKEKKNFSEKQ